MKIKIAIILICWSVLFASAYAIEEQSVKNVLNRNSLSIGMVSDFIPELVQNPPASLEEEAADDEIISGEDAGWDTPAGNETNITAEPMNNESGPENGNSAPYNLSGIPLPE